MFQILRNLQDGYAEDGSAVQLSEEGRKGILRKLWKSSVILNLHHYAF